MSIHTDIEEERKATQPDANQLRTFRAYAKGRQRGTLTPGQQRILRGLVGNRFADNVCGMVLEQISNRVLLTRFEVAADDQTASQAQLVEQFLRGVWTFNSLPALSAAAHYATLRDGNHAIALAWDGDTTGRVRLARESWWDGKQGLWVAYDDAGQPSYAVKDWRAREGLRRTIWYEDRIERYIGGGDNGWRSYQLGSDTEWPMPWLDGNKKPLGIPIVHFANRTTPNDGAGDERGNSTSDAPEYGLSILAGGVLGLQDEINDVQRDISAAARFTAYQMYWATGITPKVDQQNNPIPFIVEPGAMFTDEGKDAAFGVMAAGSLQELERTLTVKLQAVSRATSVPQHLITGDWPSGEALMRSERPLTDKAESLGRVIGPAWSSVAHKATRLANAFGRQDLNEQLLIGSVFAPAERRDPLTRAQIAKEEAPFVSARQTLRTLGYAPNDVERIIEERNQETLRQVATVIQKLQVDGYSPQQALRELGYTDAQITAMADEAAQSSEALGAGLLGAFDRGA